MDARTIAASLTAADRADLRDIASGARVFTRHIFFYDDGLVEKRLSGMVTDYSAVPLQITALGSAVLAVINADGAQRKDGGEGHG